MEYDESAGLESINAMIAIVTSFIFIYYFACDYAWLAPILCIPSGILIYVFVGAFIEGYLGDLQFILTIILICSWSYPIYLNDRDIKGIEIVRQISDYLKKSLSDEKHLSLGFDEDLIRWDNMIQPYRQRIIRGVQRTAAKVECRNVQEESIYISHYGESARGKFFFACEMKSGIVKNHYFN